jgi:hypothetical protein
LISSSFDAIEKNKQKCCQAKNLNSDLIQDGNENILNFQIISHQLVLLAWLYYFDFIIASELQGLSAN